MPSKFSGKRRFRRRRRRKMPIRKLIKKVINSSAEHKYNTESEDFTSLTVSTPHIDVLSVVSQGAAVQDRIGLIVTPARLRVRYNIQLNDSNAEASVRVFIIQSMEKNNPSNLPDTFTLMPTLRDAEFSYRILYDRSHEFSLGIHQDIRQEVSIPGKRMADVRWGSTTSTDFNKGAIFIHFVTDNTIADTIQGGWHSHFYYTDV